MPNFVSAPLKTIYLIDESLSSSYDAVVSVDTSTDFQIIVQAFVKIIDAVADTDTPFVVVSVNGPLNGIVPLLKALKLPVKGVNLSTEFFEKLSTSRVSYISKADYEKIITDEQKHAQSAKDMSSNVSYDPIDGYSSEQAEVDKADATKPEQSEGDRNGRDGHGDLANDQERERKGVSKWPHMS